MKDHSLVCNLYLHSQFQKQVYCPKRKEFFKTKSIQVFSNSMRPFFSSQLSCSYKIMKLRDFYCLNIGLIRITFQLTALSPFDLLNFGSFFSPFSIIIGLFSGNFNINCTFQQEPTSTSVNVQKLGSDALCFYFLQQILMGLQVPFSFSNILRVIAVGS